MKKIISLVITLALISLFATRLLAGVGDNCPKSGDGIPLTDFNFLGAKYVIVTSTTSWTTIDTAGGVLYDVYTIRATSTTSGTCYLVATTTSTTLFNLKIENDDENTSATDYLDNDRLMDSVGQGYPLRYTVGLKAKSSNINLDFVILYRDE